MARLRHRQYGVVPFRRSRTGQLQVLLVTSRGTGRWVIPKGWPMPRRTPAIAAQREAYEEAGVKGALLSGRPIGSYCYRKIDRADLGKIKVKLFMLRVKKQALFWPECGQRRTRWFSVRRAAALVGERGLSRLLRSVPDILERHRTLHRGVGGSKP